MGIPKFFRWLTRRYPLILKNINQEEDCPPIDNLYLDLNGIVHNCIHGNDAKLHERVSKLTDFDEVWANIMKAIDEIVHTVKPRKLLFLAVDGVAPRAKMNQQRARRFRSAKDSLLLREQLLAQGKEAPELFDSNAISPGTEFMFELNKQLEFYVQFKINTDPMFKQLEVVLSDSSVPGEGEHKMMDFIRQAKTQSEYDPNTRHCFYGADADLIMLSLLTHEPNFMIIREEHVVKKTKAGGVQRLDIQKTFNFQLIFISLLREYFQLEYSSLATQMRMRFDLERIIDDFVFFCFFIGNDFLPSLSALDISEGSLDQLIDLYKKLLPQMTDYITEAGKIYWDRAEPFIEMLGKHEVESFRMRIESIKHAKQERIVSFSEDFGLQQELASVDQKTLIQRKIKEKLTEKKLIKILHLKTKKKDKQFKRFCLLKRFEEDEELEATGGLTKHQKEIRAQMLTKFSALLEKQRIEERNMKSEGDATPVQQEESKNEILKDIVAGIKEEYFSDLCPDDIPDDEVSDVNEADIDIEQIQKQNKNIAQSAQIKAQEEIIDKYSQENLEFMTTLIQKFSQDPVEAKAFYYKTKLKQDVRTPDGTFFKKKMLTKYLEGLQWVLYYYYRGAQHWRWYYPFHYAPMISDIDESIVQNFLKGKVTIDEFEVDYNCAEKNIPYTPFQQLLSIMPIKSIKLLPPGYESIAKSETCREYFPMDFDIDLNGRALPWEAACLIPFVDEALFIEKEANLLSSSPLNPEEHKRNQVYFYFKRFKYDATLKGQKKQLVSTIKKIQNLNRNLATVDLIHDYQDVGKHSFLPKLLAGVVQPCPDFPSLKWIGANSIDYDIKIINRVEFKRVLLKIPSCLEDKGNDKLEDFVEKLAKSPNKEMYIGLPYQIEAFPTVFQDDKNTFTLYGDVYTNVFKVHKEAQQFDHDKWVNFVQMQKAKLQEAGYLVDEGTKAFISINRLKSVQYDNKAHLYYKVYEEQSEHLPLCLIMKRRDPNHYLNMNQRCNSHLQSFVAGSNVICLNTQLFGVVGTVNQIDQKHGTVKVQFDKESEEQKIHDPFLGLTVLRDYHSSKDSTTKRYYSDSQIEQQLRLPKGVVNKITGNFLVAFNDRDSYEKKVLDLGLNIKNFTKKQHIPDYVRFVADPDQIADNQYDDYHHNQHARGARHVRKHWEFSQECFDIIKEYTEKYKEVFDGLIRSMKGKNQQVSSLKDLFGKNIQDEQKIINRFKEASAWIEKSPLSHLPFVEMGFDALNSDLIIKIDQHKNIIKEKFQAIQLNCREFEYLPPNMVYQECFPYWCQAYSNKSVDDYKVGDRVININSTKREYVPFGLRGTVVGHTNDRVIVLFDEQFLGGTNIMNHCQDYTGGNINPNFLINLTHKFSSLLKKNLETVLQFTEQPIAGDTEAQDLHQVRSELMMRQDSSSSSAVSQSSGASYSSSSYQSSSYSQQQSYTSQQQYHQPQKQQHYQGQGQYGGGPGRGARGGGQMRQQRGPHDNYQQNQNQRGGQGGGGHYQQQQQKVPQQPAQQQQQQQQPQYRPKQIGLNSNLSEHPQEQQQQPKLTAHRQVYLQKPQSEKVEIQSLQVTVVAKQESFAQVEENKQEEVHSVNSELVLADIPSNISMPSTQAPQTSTFNLNTTPFIPSKLAHQQPEPVAEPLFPQQQTDPFIMPPVDVALLTQQLMTILSQPGSVPAQAFQQSPDFETLKLMMNQMAAAMTQTPPMFNNQNTTDKKDQE